MGHGRPGLLANIMILHSKFFFMIYIFVSKNLYQNNSQIFFSTTSFLCTFLCTLFRLHREEPHSPRRKAITYTFQLFMFLTRSSAAVKNTFQPPMHYFHG